MPLDSQNATANRQLALREIPKNKEQISNKVQISSEKQLSREIGPILVAREMAAPATIAHPWVRAAIFALREIPKNKRKTQVNFGYGAFSRHRQIEATSHIRGYAQPSVVLRFRHGDEALRCEVEPRFPKAWRLRLRSVLRLLSYGTPITARISSALNPRL